MQSIRCLIADDEPLALRLLESYCRRLDFVEVAGCYTSAAEALEAMRDGVDVAVLDIQMPQMTGIELARQADGSGVDIIFATAYPDYALDGFRVHASDYLLKPVSFDDFADSLRRVAARRHTTATTPRGGHITVRSDYMQVRIDFDDIVYVEGLKDYVKIYTRSRQRPVMTLMNLKTLESLLPDDKFVRVHRSYIVAFDSIGSYDRSHVVADGVDIPVGDTYRSRVLAKLSDTNNQ